MNRNEFVCIVFRVIIICQFHANNNYDKLFLAKTNYSFLVMLMIVYLVVHKNSNCKYVITYLNTFSTICVLNDTNKQLEVILK